MSDVRLLDYDPLTKQRQRFVYDAATDSFTIINDIVDEGDSLLTRAAEFRKVNDKHPPWGELAHVAHIPPTIADELYRKGILQDEAALKRWLNDPDNKVFRTREGKV